MTEDESSICDESIIRVMMDKETMDIQKDKIRRHCPTCECGGRKESYKTFDVISLNEIPMVVVCSNGHLFSMWTGE